MVPILQIFFRKLKKIICWWFIAALFVVLGDRGGTTIKTTKPFQNDKGKKILIQFDAAWERVGQT